MGSPAAAPTTSPTMLLARLASRDYALPPPPPRPARRRACRRTLPAALLALAAGLWLFAHFVHTPWLLRTRALAPLFGPRPLPPLYDAYAAAEDALLPPHRDPFANGTRYLWVPAHPQCASAPLRLRCEC